MQNYRYTIWLCAIFIIAFAYITDGNRSIATAGHLENQQNNLAATVDENGIVRILVQLNLAVEAEGNLRSSDARDSQRAMISAAQTILEQESQFIDGAKFLSRFETLPLVVMEVDSAGLAALETRTDIAYIVEDELSTTSSKPSLESSRSIIGAEAFHSAGYTGNGSVVAILDTGVDREHKAFTTGRNRIIAEGCFSTQSTTYGGVYSVCPDGVENSTQPGAADDCIDEVQAIGLNGATTDCKHGTHVAGIIGANDGDSLIGIAPDVDLIPVQVFSAFTSYNRMLSFTSDQIRGLEYILTLTEEFNIVAVNMSLGGGYNPESCNFDVRRQAILNLHSVGVATIIAAGNEGFKDGVGKPGCIDEAITVGATNDSDLIAPFSNISTQIDLLAPGSSIRSAFPNNTTGTMSGTSMAAPIVAGSFALLSQSDPEMTIAKKLDTLKTSGKMINDERSSAVVTGMKRVDLESALMLLAGHIYFELNTPPVLFHKKAETISLTLLNDSDLPASGVIVSATVPAEFELLISSVSHEGAIEDKTIIWKNLTLDANQSMTVTFEAIAYDYGDYIFRADMLDSNQQKTEVDYAISVESTVACNSYESFEDGLPSTSSSWDFDNDSYGQIRQTPALFTHGQHSLVLEDSVYDGIVTLNTAEFKIDAENTNIRRFNFSWIGHGIYSAHPDTGLFMSTDRGLSWFKIATPTAASNLQPLQWETVDIDLNQAAEDAGKTINSVPFLRFQFMGDGPLDLENVSLSSGLIIDDVQINCGGQLTWDGEGETASWSDPDNWSPNLRPNGNDLRFDSSSPLRSEVDIDFKNPIGDLIITANWAGTLTQTMPLAVSGDFMQKNGLIHIKTDSLFSVDGSYIFIDGALQQTKSITNGKTVFLEIKNQDQQIIQNGFEIETITNENQLQTATVTISGPTWGPNECASAQQIGKYGINRCFEIATSATFTNPITARIWLEDSELINGGDLTLPGGGIEPGDGITSTATNEGPVFQLMSFDNSNWVEVDQFQLGQKQGRPFVEVDFEDGINQAKTLMTQKIVETPLAVTLSKFQTGSPINSDSRLILITFLLLLLTFSISVRTLNITKVNS